MSFYELEDIHYKSGYRYGKAKVHGTATKKE